MWVRNLSYLYKSFSLCPPMYDLKSQNYQLLFFNLHVKARSDFSHTHMRVSARISIHRNTNAHWRQNISERKADFVIWRVFWRELYSRNFSFSIHVLPSYVQEKCEVHLSSIILLGSKASNEIVFQDIHHYDRRLMIVQSQLSNGVRNCYGIAIWIWIY